MTLEEAEVLLSGQWLASYERAIAEIVQLRGQVAQLTELLQKALARIAELEQRKPEPPSFVKPNRPPPAESKGPRKKRAAEHNTSRKRATPTRIERHALEHCPECQCRLRGESLGYSRQVAELPAPQPVEVIEHQIVKRRCPRCGEWRSPHLDLSGQVLGQGRIGVRVAALVVYLRTTLRLPVRQVQTYLETRHDLHLSSGEIAELALRHLQILGPRRLWLVNRSVENAQALADELSLTNTEGGVRSLDELDELLVEADIVLTSTGSVQPILTADRLKPLPKRRHFRPLFMVDLAVPRDIAQEVGAMTNFYLYNIDDLQHVVQQTHSLRGQEADKANAMLLAATQTCIAEIQTQDIDELIRQLRQQLYGFGELEQQRTMRKLQAADEPDVEALLEQHTQRLINKILHLPLSQLARHQPVSRLTFASAALRRLFGLGDDAPTDQEVDRK